MSLLRAKCPTCKANTAVAIGPEYECHSCGRTFAAGLVRVPRAWGDGGEPMIESALLPLDYPETSVVEPEAAQRYLESYFGDDRVNIFWADTRTFLDELRFRTGITP